MCGLTHTSSHTSGNFSSHPTFLIIVEPKQHKELVVMGFLGCKPRSSAVRWSSSYAYVATKQLNGTGVTEELNFSLYLIHLNVHTHASNSARLFGLGHVGPRAGTSPLRCRRGEQVGSVGVCEAGPMAAMLTAEMSESGEGDEMCLRRCGGVQAVKQVFGEVSKEVLSRYVGFFPFPAGGSNGGSRNGEISKEDREGVAGEREESISGLGSNVLAAVAYFNSRAVRAAKHRGGRGLARVRGREPTRPVGQGCMPHGGDPGGHVSLSVMLGPTSLPAWKFQCDFPPSWRRYI